MDPLNQMRADMNELDPNTLPSDDAHPSSPELLIGIPHLVAMSTLAGRGSDGPAEVVRAGVVIAQPVGVAGDVDDHGSVQ